MRTRRIPSRRRLATAFAAFALAALPSPVLGADTTAPTTTAPKVTFRTGVLVDTVPVPGLPDPAYRVRIRISWSGTDDAGGTGIATYQLSKSTDGGATWVSLSKTLTATAVTSTIPTPIEGLALLKNLRYRVRAVDKAGNVGPWATGPNLRPRIIDDRNPALVYDRPESIHDRVDSIGGKAHLLFKGASVSYTFTGRTAVLITRKDKTGDGPLSIYVDGTLLRTLEVSTIDYQVPSQAWAVSWSKPGTHTIKIVVNGSFFWFDGLGLTDNSQSPLTGLPGTDTAPALEPGTGAAPGAPAIGGWLVIALLLISIRMARRRV